MNLSQSFDLVWPKLQHLNEPFWNNDDGTKEKVFAMTVLGLGSFLFGMLPAIISERNRQRFPLTKSLMLCFGAGILLATSLIHILPEVRKQNNSNWAEMSLCGGFLFIYFIDELVHCFVGDSVQHSHSHSPNNNYGAVNESQALLNDQSSFSNRDVGETNGRHTEPISQSISTSIGLFAALSLHSAIEGIAIGVQNSPSKVLFLLGAVACHKFVMGFCLGLLSSSTSNIKLQLFSISFFALGGVLGIGIGIALINIPSSVLSVSVLSTIQGLAGGTLLYVAICEVIPREKALWHHGQKIAGIAQFVTFSLGFLTMALINFFLSDDD
ncbi:zinc/iron regulated transporter-related protein 88E [Haematobia irritans]|uniref:zinc/iron regulated transporter-related protein 88E n=1 Tax=Haematobia irritans TaxID=7368 RepID=UPI003F4F57FB